MPRLLSIFVAAALIFPNANAQTVWHPLPVGGDVSAPVPIPQSPEKRVLTAPLRRGVATVAIVIDEDGYVSRTKIVRSAGGPDLDAMALATARRFRFEPARQKGNPVSVVATTDVNVVLGSGETPPLPEKPIVSPDLVKPKLLGRLQLDDQTPASSCPAEASVSLIVSVEGFPKRLSIEIPGPSDQFDDAALRAVSRLRWAPATLHGVPVECPTSVKISMRC